MGKILIDIEYKAEVLKTATLEVEEGCSEQDIETILKEKGEMPISILSIVLSSEEDESIMCVDGCDMTGHCVGSSCKYYFTVCHKGVL